MCKSNITSKLEECMPATHSECAYAFMRNRKISASNKLSSVVQGNLTDTARCTHTRGLHGSTWIQKPEVRPETRVGSGPKLLRVPQTRVGFGISSLGSRVIKIRKCAFPKWTRLDPNSFKLSRMRSLLVRSC